MILEESKDVILCQIRQILILRFIITRVDLRPNAWLLLLLCSLLLSSFGPSPRQAFGQSNLTTAWNGIVEAFQSIRQADSLGAPQAAIVSLTSELNLALTYYENASRLAAMNDYKDEESYAAMSIQISSDVTSIAVALRNDLQGQILMRQVTAYSIAVVIAAASALLAVESHTIRHFFRKRKLFRTRFG